MQARDELKSILERLERKDPGAEQDAERFLKNRSTAEMIDIEEGLVREGLSQESVRHLCPSHRAVTRGSRGDFRARLADAHPVAVLMDEHLLILGRLDRLEELSARAELDFADPEAPALLAEIVDQTAHLIGAEPHHQREEQVLFPALRERGVHGPPAVMEAEHVEMRALKHAAHDGALAALRTSDASLWPKIRASASNLVATLRQHIEKEDGILFPLAVDTIQGEEVWSEMRRRCDDIGYCCGSEGHAHAAETCSGEGAEPKAGGCGGW